MQDEHIYCSRLTLVRTISVYSNLETSCNRLSLIYKYNLSQVLFIMNENQNSITMYTRYK